jgi:UTP--glucose-1-phosphate uridylyltransferase
MKKIKKAVIPVAGLGTRFLPATKAVPKEMLPIIDKPMIQYIVEEAVQSGIEQIIFITSRHKEAIENHFDYAYEVEDTLLKKGKTELANISQSVAEMCQFVSIRQKNPLGLGHAILCAEKIIGQEPFAILLGDDLIDATVPCLQQLIQVYDQHQTSVIATMRVPLEETSKYGTLKFKVAQSQPLTALSKNTKLHTVEDVVEKPKPSESPSDFVIPGRYICDYKVFEYLKQIPKSPSGEYQLTDALKLLAKNEGLLAYEFEGHRYDTGDRLGYLEATLAYALKRDDLKDAVKKLIKTYV